MKGGNSTWNVLDNQTLRRMIFLVPWRCLAVIIADSFWKNYWFLILNEEKKNTWCQTRIRIFVIFLLIELKVGL